MKPALPVLAGLLHAFFHEWLVEQRNASHRTVWPTAIHGASFFALWLHGRSGRFPHCALKTSPGRSPGFLQHIEQNVAAASARGTAVSPRSAVSSHSSPTGTPRCQALCSEVLHVPFKRAPKKAMCYLESAEVAAILSQPDQSTRRSTDHTLLSLLYNTGARIQEALDLRPQDVHLKSPTHVACWQGRKERSPRFGPKPQSDYGALAWSPRRPMNRSSLIVR